MSVPVTGNHGLCNSSCKIVLGYAYAFSLLATSFLRNTHLHVVYSKRCKCITPRLSDMDTLGACAIKILSQHLSVAVCVNCNRSVSSDTQRTRLNFDRGMSVVARAVTFALPNTFSPVSSRTVRVHRATQIGRMVSSTSAVAAPANVGKVRNDVQA